MSRPLDAPTFFVDRDLGPRFFDAISADNRFRVEFHDAHFSDPSTDDSDWLRLIAAKNWIGVTHDKKIRSQHRAIIAAYRSKVVIVVGNRTMADHASNFIATYPRIERFIRSRPGPYTAKLYHPTPADLRKLRPKGRIELWAVGERAPPKRTRNLKITRSAARPSDRYATLGGPGRRPRPA